MTSVRRTGDWQLARALLGGAPAKLKAATQMALRQEAELLRREIVQGLTKQAPGGKPLQGLKATTLATRRLKGFHGQKALLVRADLRNSIATIVRNNEAFIGVPRSKRSRDGKELVRIGAVHEFGSQPIVIPMTPAMRGFICRVLREAGEPLRGKREGSGKGVVVVQIPARPFLRPAFQKFKQGVDRRFLERVARLMGLGGGT